MRIENMFTATAARASLWNHLLDVERIAPCLPGAELTETVDDRTWKGRVNVTFGPVSMAFAGTVVMDERNDAEHLVRLRAKGTEQKGKGAATALVTGRLEPGAADGETAVRIEADITLTGAAAQLSRGLLPEISRKLTQQFADCLQEQMRESVQPAASPPVDAAAGPKAAEDAPPATAEAPSAEARPADARPAGATASSASDRPPAPAGARSLHGLSLAASALWALINNAVRQLLRRLFGGARKA
jgi:carbon monoxide dehydrogenase subunit G